MKKIKSEKPEELEDKEEKLKKEFNPEDIKEIEGEEYVKIHSLGELDGLMIDNFYIKISRKIIKVEGRKCFMCGKDFKGKIKELTSHHSLPKVLKPVYNITIPLCEECHKKLNSLYVKHPNTTPNQVSNNFSEFKENYEKLKEMFSNHKLDRGAFGEGLWTNLINYLEDEENRRGNICINNLGVYND